MYFLRKNINQKQNTEILDKRFFVKESTNTINKLLHHYGIDNLLHFTGGKNMNLFRKSVKRGKRGKRGKTGRNKKWI